MYSITSTWTELLQQFFPIFTAPGAYNFVRLITGWVLCTTRRIVTGIIPHTTDRCIHFDPEALPRIMNLLFS